MDSALEKDTYGEIGENRSESQYILEEKLTGLAGGLDINHVHF